MNAVVLQGREIRNARHCGIERGECEGGERKRGNPAGIGDK